MHYRIGWPARAVRFEKNQAADGIAGTFVYSRGLGLKGSDGGLGVLAGFSELTTPHGALRSGCGMTDCSRTHLPQSGVGEPRLPVTASEVLARRFTPRCTV